MTCYRHEEDVERLARALKARDWRLVTAESCTGGLIAAACTALAGSSDWFDRAFITYSNLAKQDMLGVPQALLRDHGAVSEEVAMAMAQGAMERSPADVALSVTGIAGPGGAVPGKPVGTVWMARVVRGQAPQAVLLQLSGDRTAVRHAAVREALQSLTRCAEERA